MFSKLALKNVTRSLKDYSVYFLTLLFGVCLFYVFNSMDSQQVMAILSSGGNAGKNAVRAILTLIDVLSVFVSVVLAFLILYANSFMVRRRKKELGTYLLLGMSQGRISALLFLETVLIGLFALGMGLVLGVFLSQFISLFAASLFEITLPQFQFVFSVKALFKTVLYFGIIFLVVMCFNSLSVSRCKLIDLMQADKRNEDLKVKSLWSSVVMFLLGAALLAVAYAMLLTRGLLRIDTLFFVMLGLGTAGTLLFFRSLSGFLLRVCQQNKRLYYKGLNMFILRQFNSRIGSTYVSMTVICLMLLLSIGITACSIGLNNTVSSLANAQAPYDLSVMAYRIGEDDRIRPADVAGALDAAGFDTGTEFAASGTYEIWYVEFSAPALPGGDSIGVTALTLSSYNTIRAFLGEAPLALEEGRYGLVAGGAESALAGLVSAQAGIDVNGVALGLDPDAVTYGLLSLDYGTQAADYLILPDAAMARARASADASGSHTPFVTSYYFAANYRTDAAKEVTEAKLQEAYSRRGEGASFSRALLGEDGGSYRLNTKLDIYMETMGSKILVLFLGIYLGIVFLLCSAAVLALQQLSQAADNQRRYAILSRLGVEEKMRNRSVYIQVFLAFSLPLALAVVHAAVGMTAANAVIAEVGHLDSTASSTVTALFLLVVYGAYFLATCWGSRRIIRGK